MTSGLFCDLHIHSCFSIASSSRMLPSCLVEGCRKKGIGVLGSGDALHAGWRDLWNRIPDTGEVLVVPTAEVEDHDRVHHLIILDSFERFEDLASDLGRHAARLAETGRPHVRLPGSEIAGRVHDLGGLIGPGGISAEQQIFGRVGEQDIPDAFLIEKIKGKGEFHVDGLAGEQRAHIRPFIPAA